ncbi:MAG: efflux RND transporter periplasmic adaptor subunit [Candidatus Buchananbacteria bacterium]|jgi:RND family efflux transporter MFP subunit
MLKKLFQLVLKHRIISAVILAVLAIAGYFGYQSFFGAKEIVSYVESAVEKGTIISSISGTGQVSASNQINLTAKASSKMTFIGATAGQAVKSGAIIAKLDATDAAKTVRDAEMSLETAQLAMEKLKQPATALELLQAENSLSQAEDTKRKADDAITKAYEDSLNSIAEAFLDFPTIIAGLNDIQYGTAIGKSESTIGSSQDNEAALSNSLSGNDRLKLVAFQTSAATDYQIARKKYDANFSNYRYINRSAEPAEIEALLAETLNTARAMAQAAKSQSNYLDTWVDLRIDQDWSIFAQVKTYQSNLSTYISQTNGHLSSLLSLQTSIKDNLQTKLDAEKSIEEKTISLSDLKEGVDSLDLRTQQLSLQAKVNALADAREKYADYIVTAPFDGVIASVTAKVGDEMTSGGAIATIITPQKIAELSLNEVDVAKVKVGQKATITFDALEDLSIAGQVVEVDSLGTISSGVASYTVKISFDEQDDRIKSGMTATANIIINSSVDVLTVPASAIKTNSDGSAYVEVMENGALTKKIVVIGLTDDVNTEIKSGLSEGDKVVSQTVSTAASTSKTKSTTGSSNKSSGSIMGAMGGGPRD